MKHYTRNLEYYGFDQHSRDWIRSYLEYRSSYIVIGSAESEIKSSPHGVPQGSVLGPLLYLIYVNEMPSASEDDLCMNQMHFKYRETLQYWMQNVWKPHNVCR